MPLPPTMMGPASAASDRRWAEYLAPSSNLGLESKIPQLSSLLIRHASASDAQKRSMESHQAWLKTFSQRLETAEQKQPEQQGSPVRTSGTHTLRRSVDGSPLAPQQPRVTFSDVDDDGGVVPSARAHRRGGSDDAQDIVIRVRLEK